MFIDLITSPSRSRSSNISPELKVGGARVLLCYLDPQTAAPHPNE